MAEGQTERSAWEKVKGNANFLRSKVTTANIRRSMAWTLEHQPTVHVKQVYEAPRGNVYDQQIIMMIGAVGALGRETARRFVLHGAARLFLVGPNPDDLGALFRSLKADPELNAVNPNCGIIYLVLDLSDRRMVRDFAVGMAARIPEMHVLLLNAATFVPGFETIDDTGRPPANRAPAVERMMQVNCYSQCLIFMVLRASLRRGAITRNIASHATFVTCPWMANQYRDLPEDPAALRTFLCNEHRFHYVHQFHLTKLLTTFFVYYYSRLVDINDGRLIVNTVWPGILRHSRLYRHLDFNTRRILEEGRSLFGRHEERAARVVIAATRGHPNTHGDCIIDNGVLRGENLVLQHAHFGCEQLVYRLICMVMRGELGETALNLPIDPNREAGIVPAPWNARQ